MSSRDSALDIVAHDAPDTAIRGAQDSVTYHMADPADGLQRAWAKGGAWSTGLQGRVGMELRK